MMNKLTEPGKPSLSEFYNILQDAAYKNEIPLTGGFELTSRCNLRCRMCYVRSDGPSAKDELPAEAWIRLAQEALEAGTVTAFLTGGEPLLRSDFWEIYEAFCKMGFRLTLFTNGSLLTDEAVRRLAAIPPAGVDITLYGSSAETYEKLCGSGDACLRVYRAIDNLLKYGIFTRIKCTVVRSNRHEYHSIRDFAKQRNLEFYESEFVHGHRDLGAAACESERIPPEEMAALRENDAQNAACRIADVDWLRSAYRGLPAMSCMAAKCSCFINWQGRMVPCALFSEPYTEPLKTGFQAAWDAIRVKAKEIPVPPKCQSCEQRAFCPSCPAKLLLETGRFDTHADYFCALAQMKESVITARNKEQTEKARAV